MDEIKELTEIILGRRNFEQSKREGKYFNKDTGTDISEDIVEMAEGRARERVRLIRLVDAGLTSKDVVTVGKMLLEYEASPEYKQEVESKDALYYAVIPRNILEDGKAYTKFLEESVERHNRMIVERVVKKFHEAKGRVHS